MEQKICSTVRLCLTLVPLTVLSHFLSEGAPDAISTWTWTFFAAVFSYATWRSLVWIWSDG